MSPDTAAVVSPPVTPGSVPREVELLLDELVARVTRALKSNLVGVYLRGSIATGGFDPETSDIDFLVVTNGTISKAEYAALERMHTDLRDLDNPFARRLEGSYIDRNSLRMFGPDERRHPSIGTDWEFQWDDHRQNWIIERWVLRERGVVLTGPSPETLIDPISIETLKDAARSEIQVRLEHWASGDDVPTWLEPRFYQAFEVTTVCRALYTLKHGTAPSKTEAVAWARETLPEPWASLVRRTERWHADKTLDPSTVPEVQRFVRWAVSSNDTALGS